MGSGIKQKVAGILDRPAGRSILATAVNLIARLRGKTHIRVFYENDRWFHRVKSMTFPGHRQFEEWPHRFTEFESREARYLADAKDYWMALVTPPSGATVVDVGAGEGEDVLAFSRAVGNKGRVLAIEAFPATFQILSEFCSRNSLHNTIPVQVALGETMGTFSFEESENWVENSVDTTGMGHVKVPSMPLSMVCKAHGISDIYYLKMNIEGAEISALKGMINILQSISYICVSCHDFRADRGEGEHFRTRIFVIDFLQNHGFSLSFRDDPRPHVRDQVFGKRILSEVS